MRSSVYPASGIMPTAGRTPPPGCNNSTNASGPTPSRTRTRPSSKTWPSTPASPGRESCRPSTSKPSSRPPPSTWARPRNWAWSRSNAPWCPRTWRTCRRRKIAAIRRSMSNAKERNWDAMTSCTRPRSRAGSICGWPWTTRRPEGGCWKWQSDSRWR